MRFSPLALAATALLSGSTHAFVPIHSTSSLSLQVGSSPSLTASSTSTQLGVFGIFGSSTNKVDDKTTLSTKTSAMPTLEKEEVQDLFYLWNDALKTLEPEIVASRYSEDAILLPTVSDTPRTDKEGIVDYFTSFLKVRAADGYREGRPVTMNDNPHALLHFSIDHYSFNFSWETAGTSRRNRLVPSLRLAWHGKGCGYLRIHNGHHGQTRQGSILLRLHLRTKSVEDLAPPFFSNARRGHRKRRS